MYEVTLIPGDGIGPELCQAACRCITAAGVNIHWDVQPAGADALATEGTPVPDRTLKSIERNKVALKGPIQTPPGTGLRSVNVHLRQALDLYASVRPCKYYEGVRAPCNGAKVDLIIVRENTEDLYAGIEFEVGDVETRKILETIREKTHKHVQPDSGLSIKPISVTGSKRIVKFAFDYAKSCGRDKVTAVHKANIMKCTDGLFLHVARDVAKEYAGSIAFEDRIVDNMCTQLLLRPIEYNVLVMPNLYGDILSDMAAGLVGGLSVAPAANFGNNAAVFEAMHGIALKHRGQNKVNPTALILAGVLMLRHLREFAAADKLETAVADVLREGKFVTYDMKDRADTGSAVGTREMADAVIAKMRS